MYPRNSNDPPIISVGAVIQISDGAVQTIAADITVKVKVGMAAEVVGGGTKSVVDGIVLYKPTQAETNTISFVVIASKTGCIPVAVTVVPSAASNAGFAVLAAGSLAATTFDSNTAFPLTAVDAGSTKVARTGADNDDLKTISDQVGGLPAQPMTLTSDYNAAKTAATQASVNIINDYLDTEIAAIKAKTDTIPANLAVVGSAMTLTPAYDAAKTAASQASINTIDDFLDTEIAAILTVIQKLDGMLELNGSLCRWTVAALSQSPTGGDWTTGEKEQIRSALGINGIKTTAVNGQLQMLIVDNGAIKAKTDSLPNVNITSVNSVPVKGQGSLADPWGP